MASSRETKQRIAASVLFATGFWDAVAGRFLWQRFTVTAPATLPGNEPRWRDLAGAVHVHTTYSDGAGDVTAVMQAAHAARIDWVLLADHNTLAPLRDGWEAQFSEPDGPLLLIGTEITLEHGAFLLALDLPPDWTPTRDLPPQQVIDDVNRQGGLPLISLPFDVKHPWRAWNTTGCAGLEVLNLSTIARRHINLLSLLWLLPIYQAQGALACLRALVTRPDDALQRWDQWLRSGEFVLGIGALDAHALMKIGRKKYAVPSYADSFQAATTHVLIPENTPPGCRRRVIYDALRAGRAYFCYDCLARPRTVNFTAQRPGDATAAQMGETITLSAGNDAVQIHARVAAHQDRRNILLRLYENGKIVAAGDNGTLTARVTRPGAYRLEAYLVGARIGPLRLNTRPWLFTNPIYVRAAAS